MSDERSFRTRISMGRHAKPASSPRHRVVRCSEPSHVPHCSCALHKAAPVSVVAGAVELNAHSVSRIFRHCLVFLHTSLSLSHSLSHFVFLRISPLSLSVSLCLSCLLSSFCFLAASMLPLSLSLSVSLHLVLSLSHAHGPPSLLLPSALLRFAFGLPLRTLGLFGCRD